VHIERSYNDEGSRTEHLPDGKVKVITDFYFAVAVKVEDPDSGEQLLSFMKSYIESFDEEVTFFKRKLILNSMWDVQVDIQPREDKTKVSLSLDSLTLERYYKMTLVFDPKEVINLSRFVEDEEDALLEMDSVVTETAKKLGWD
jgi:hypothetical protein